MRVASLQIYSSHLILTIASVLLSSIHPVRSQDPASPSDIEQPFLHPNRDDVLVAGGTFTIQWTADTRFANITLELWDKTSWGYSRDFGSLCYHWVNPFCGTIVSHAPNTGSYVWHIPKPGSDFPRSERVFWIKMYVDDYFHPDIGNEDPVLSYSSNFQFAEDPGQDDDQDSDNSTSSVSSTPAPTRAPNVLQPQTVTVTIHDLVSTGLAATTTPVNTSATVTGAPRRNISGEAMPVNAAATRAGRILPALLSLLLGMI